MTGREPAGVRRVDRDGKAALGQEVAGGLDDRGGAGGAMAIAKHDVGPVSSRSQPRLDGIEWQSTSRQPPNNASVSSTSRRSAW